MRRAWRIVSVLSPALLFFGCDLLAGAFGGGYELGYGCVDALYGCYEADQQRRQERAEEVQVWQDACGIPVETTFSTQAALDDADRACRDQYGYDSALVICDDVGQEVGTEPPDCRPFDEPSFGATVDGDYGCPSGVSGDRKCLCCTDAVRADCALEGGFCRDSARCCAGTCVIDEQIIVDGGVVAEDGHCAQ